MPTRATCFDEAHEAITIKTYELQIFENPTRHIWAITTNSWILDMNGRRSASLQLTPWYKQPGPWVLIALLAGVLIVGITALILVSRPPNEPTVGDYLSQASSLDAFIEDRQRAQLRGISAVLSFSNSSVSAGTAGPVTANKLKLLLSHPRESGSEVSITLKKVTEGLYSGDFSSPISAGWNWVLRSSEGEGWQLDGEVYVDDLGYDSPADGAAAVDDSGQQPGSNTTDSAR